MTAKDVLNYAQRAGIELYPEGRSLRFRAANGSLTTQVRAMITKHKPEIIRLLNQRIGDALDSYLAYHGNIVRIRSKVLGEDVWWVRDASFRDHVPNPEFAVYTAAELRDLISVGPDNLRHFHSIKKAFDGEIQR